MTEVLHHDTLAYLAHRPNSFWQWQEHARVVAWESGSTVAFREELDAALLALAPQGLPPLEAVLLLLAACRSSWGRCIAERDRLQYLTAFWELATNDPAGELVRRYGPAAIPDELVHEAADRRAPLSRMLSHVLEGLNCVHRLPERWRDYLGGKAYLIQVLLEPVTVRRGEEESKLVAAALREGFPAEAITTGGKVPAPGPAHGAWPLVDAIVALYEALVATPVTPERIDLRRQTGLDELPRPAAGDLRTSEPARRRIGELMNDEQFVGLAQVARDLLAVADLPRRISGRDDLPAGGLSDITNRGTLDRLLPGELAHDDLTLAVRIALKEALYYRRESPPRSSVTDRRLLIDTGIRMWGVPRVYAAAVALALAATADAEAHIRTFHTTPTGVAEVDLLSQEGLTRLLATLTPDPHPGEALPAFLHDRASRDTDADCVLITHEDVLTDADFRRCLAAQDGAAMYVASVDRDGMYRLRKCSTFGQRVLREAKLDLAAIYGRPEDRTPTLIREDHDPSLPVILSAEPFPLLLPPSPLRNRSTWRRGTGLAAVSRDRRLLVWRDKGRGATQVMDRVPRGAVPWVHVQEATALALFLTGRREDEARLLRADLRTGRCSTLGLAGFRGAFHGACIVQGRLCVVGRRQVNAFDIHSGVEVGSLPLPDHRVIRGRFIQARSDWWALTGDDTGLRMEAVFRNPAPFDPRLVLAVFDREGVDGPWAVLRDAQIVSLADNQRVSLGVGGHPAFELKGVSPDGHRLLLSRSDAARAWLALDLETSSRTSVRPADRQAFLEPMAFAATGAHVDLRAKVGRVRAIGLDRAGCLCLKHGDGRAVRLSLGPSARTIELSAAHDLGELRCSARLRLANPPPGVGYHLRTTRWADGSRAWLDSRGMLHLRSADPLAPELTIVLVRHGPTAGWGSDGTWHGRAYYVGDHPTVDAETFYQAIRRFTERLQ